MCSPEAPTLLLLLSVDLGVVARLGLRPSATVDPRQHLDSPLGLVEHLLTLREQPDPTLVTNHRLAQADLPLFQIVNNPFQGRKRRLEA